MPAKKPKEMPYKGPGSRWTGGGMVSPGAGAKRNLPKPGLRMPEFLKPKKKNPKGK